MSRSRLDRLLEYARIRDLPPSQRRRAVLKLAAGLAVSAVTFPLGSHGALAQPRFTAYPFALGVGSGSPRPDGAVLWTRLAQDPLLPDGGMTGQAIDVRWEVARDDQFRDITQSGTARALPELAHSLRIEVAGLDPARWYWYRFMAGDAVSPAGRTRTAPAPNASPGLFSFAFASCQQYEQGYYAAHRHMAAENLDLIVFLGDYIYESSWGRNHVRKHATPEPYTLADYRIRHAQYKSDPDLQASHASAPWLVTWDDHEVDNDYQNDRSQDLDPGFLARRADAYQAYFEHMPLRAISTPRNGVLRLYDRITFGDLAQFHVLDDRQYRSHHACLPPNTRNPERNIDCLERADPQRTLLGREQEAWLADGFASSKAQWNIIAQQTLIAQLDRLAGPAQDFWNDGWDGYPEARNRLMDAIAQHKPSNPVVVGGDVHCTWVADLKRDFDDAASPVLATEFCGTSITSQGPSQKQVVGRLAENPHIRYGNGTKRGYMRVDLTRKSCTASLRGLDSEKDAATGIATVARFVVADGKPGARRA